MTPSAQPGASAEPACSTALGRPSTLPLGIILAAAFVLMFTFLTFPPAPTPSQGAYEADASLSAVLNYAHEHGLQFGKDLAYTYGPLGFLVFFYFSPDTARLHMTTDLALCFTVALGLCLVARRLRWVWAGLLLAGFAWGAPNIYPRIDLFFSAGLLCWGLLCALASGRELRWSCFVFTGLAAFSALAKVSYVFISPGCVVLIAGVLWGRGHGRLAATMVVGFPGAFLLGWLAAGQSPAHVGAYLTNAVAMAQGYNAALGWEELPWAREGGIIAGLLLLPLLVLRLRPAFAGEKNRLLLRGLLLAWLLWLIFTVYKHGFVRGFVEDLAPTFMFVAVLAPVLALFPVEGKRLSIGVTALTVSCWLVALLTLQLLSFPTFTEQATRPFQTFVQNLHWTFKPADYLRTSAETFDSIRRGARLTKLGSIVGNASVDVFGRRQLYALANELNYRPRPIPQSYAACNARLMALNEEFYLSKAAPEYVLFQLDTFDRKFPPLEDARVLRDLLLNYQPVASEGEFLLMKAHSRDVPRLELLQEGTVRPGEPVDVSKYGTTPLWLEIDVEPSWLGRLRQVLYRPPVVRVAAWEQPHKALLVRRRAPASMLAAGFLASPLVLNNADILSVYTTNALRRPMAYSIELGPSDEHLWQQRIRYRLYKIDNPLGRCTATVPAPPHTDSGRFALFHSRAWRSGAEPGSAAELLSYGLFVLAPCVSAGLLLLLIQRVKRSSRPVPLGWLVAGNVLVFLVLLSSVFLTGETYFRFFYDTTDSLGYTKVCQRWVQRHWQLNQAGCRDNVEYSPVLPPGRRRIAFIGDSFAAGHGIKNVEDRFANRLRRAHPEWDVQVLANVGLDTGGEQILLNRALRQGYQLDTVVLVYCLNDVGDLMPEQTHAYDQLFAQQHGWLTQHSYLVNLLYNRYKASHIPLLRNYFPFVREAYRGALWLKQQQRLKAFADCVQAHGGHFAVMTFPFLDVLGPGYPYKFVHQELDQFWGELRVPHLDLLRIYEGLSPQQLTVNAYDAHPNQLANKLAADALEKFLPAVVAGRPKSE